MKLKLIAFSHTLMLTLSVACSSNTEKKDNRSDNSSDAVTDVEQTNGETKVVDENGKDKLDNATVAQSVITGNASRVAVSVQKVKHIATPEALEMTYKRVFPATGVRRNDLNAYFKDHPEAYFTPEEKANLGGFNVSAPVGTELNPDVIKTLSLGYTRSLRGFLSDACNGLVDRETALVQTKPDKNLLVKSTEMPSMHDLNDFAIKLFGYEYPSGSAFPQVAKYFQLIKSNMNATAQAGYATTSAEYKADLRANYVLYCIAISEDPEIYIY